jgi:hypothetical protein
MFHAVLHLDHHDADLYQFNADEVQHDHLKARHRVTRQHGSEVRTEHEFFADVCKAIEPVQSVLVTGSHTSLTDLRHYVEKHRADLVKRVAAYQAVDRPTEGQLVALAREFFLKFDRMAGVPTPT